MLHTDTAQQLDAFITTCETVWSEQRLPEGPRYATRAPARLDVMGGIADYTGSLMLQAALPLDVRVGVAARNDMKVSVLSRGWSNNGDKAECTWPLSILYGLNGKLATPEAVAAHFDANGAPWARHVAGVFYTLLEAGAVPHFGGGASVVIESDIPSSAGLGASGAIATATAWALAALTERPIAPIELARLCQRSENIVVGNPSGITDKVVALLAEPAKLLQMRCQPHELLGHLQPCNGITAIAIDSGTQSEKRFQKFVETRVAAFMGLRIIEAILRQEPNPHDLTGGYLANISPTDYVERFRDRLPTKLKGREFLERFGHVDDAATRAEPETVYKVRSRTEHHIYENDRVHRFAERMNRAARTGERDAIVEAGELMYASHWSYSQRCGMGSIPTDVLVNQLRAQGVARGIYGAKVTSGGCGGTLAVLVADNPTARQAVDQACQAYKEKTGHTATVFDGSSAGAAKQPAQRLS